MRTYADQSAGRPGARIVKFTTAARVFYDARSVRSDRSARSI